MIGKAPEQIAKKYTKILDRCFMGSLRRLRRRLPLGVPLVFWTLLASLLTARVFTFLLLTFCMSVGWFMPG